MVLSGLKCLKLILSPFKDIQASSSKSDANRNDGSGEGWLHSDDESVRAVRDEDVFGPYDDKQADDRCLFIAPQR